MPKKTQEERIAGLERDMAVLLTAARAVTTPAPTKTLGVKLLDIVPTIAATLLPALVLFAIGYWFQERYKQDIEERKLGTENLKDIRDLATKLLIGGMNEQEARSAGLVMAAHGRYSVLPLLSVLESGGETQILAAEIGLPAAGLIDRPYTCRMLVEVIDNRSRRYTVITYKHVARAIADIGCKGEQGAKAELALSRLEALFAQDAEKVRQAIRGSVDPSSLASVKAELSDAAMRLKTR